MSTPRDELASLRDEIDLLDDRIAELVVERIHVAEEVADAKSRAGMDLVDTGREADVKSRYGEIFRRNELDAESGRGLAERLIEVSLEQERASESDSRRTG